MSAAKTGQGHGPPSIGGQVSRFVIRQGISRFTLCDSSVTSPDISSTSHRSSGQLREITKPPRLNPLRFSMETDTMPVELEIRQEATGSCRLRYKCHRQESRRFMMRIDSSRLSEIPQGSTGSYRLRCKCHRQEPRRFLMRIDSIKLSEIPPESTSHDPAMS